MQPQLSAVLFHLPGVAVHKVTGSDLLQSRLLLRVVVGLLRNMELGGSLYWVDLTTATPIAAIRETFRVVSASTINLLDPGDASYREYLRKNITQVGIYFWKRRLTGFSLRQTLKKQPSKIFLVSLPVFAAK